MLTVSRWFPLFVLLLGVLVPPADAQTVLSAQSGNWSDGSTWLDGVAPASGDDVIVDEPHTIRFDSSVDVPFLDVLGTLRIEDGLLLATQANVSGSLDLSNGALISSDFVIEQGLFLMSGGLLDAERVVGDLTIADGRLSVDRIEGDLTLGGGVLAPGDSPGTTVVSGALRLDGGTIEIEVESAGDAGVDHDFVDVGGDAVLDGLLDLRWIGGYLPTAGDVVDVLTAATITLGPGFTLASEGGFDVSIVEGGNGEILRLTAATVPEPSTALFVLLGAVVFRSGLRPGRARERVFR